MQKMRKYFYMQSGMNWYIIRIWKNIKENAFENVVCEIMSP